MAKKKTTKKKTGLKKRISKKTSPKKAGTSRSGRAKAPTSNGALGSMTVHEIQAKLKARERRLRSLQRKRERLLEQVAGLETEIVALSGRVSGGGPRPSNEKNLGDALAGVLKGKQMTVAEAAQAVLDSGYRTSAGTFRTIVNQRLLSDKRFKKVERGVYTV